MSADSPPPRPVVLFVDDEASIRQVFALNLRMHFDVDTAALASEAEAMLAARLYDVVICDHLMPDEVGLTFLTRMRAKFPHVQRILLTGYTDPELLAGNADAAGLASCLTKPISAAQLVEAIRQALAAR